MSDACGLEPPERCRRRARRVPRHRVPLRILGAKYVGDRRISPPNRRRKHESVSAVSVCSLGAARSSGRRFVSFLANKTRRSRPRKRVYFTVRSAVSSRYSGSSTPPTHLVPVGCTRGPSPRIDIRMCLQSPQCFYN